MPRGADQFKKRQERVAAQQADFAALKADFFALSDGEQAIVRFLEQGNDLAFALCHRVPVAGRQYPQDVICLDQEDDGTPCPGCASQSADIKSRSNKGFVNLIWRDGPVYKRNERGAPEKVNNQKVITGHADAVFLWKCSQTVFKTLLGVDADIRGLMSRDVKIRREGSGMKDTTYHISSAYIEGPQSGEQPMLVADMNLATGKYDIDKFIKPPTYEEFAALLSGQAPQGGPQHTFDRGPTGPDNQNPFQGGGPLRSSGFGS